MISQTESLLNQQVDVDKNLLPGFTPVYSNIPSIFIFMNSLNNSSHNRILQLNSNTKSNEHTKNFINI